MLIEASDCGKTKMTDKTKPSCETAGNDTSGLLLTQLTTQRARDAAELETIANAYDKYIFKNQNKVKGADWLTDKFIRPLHKDMFGEIWNWAGKYRTHNVNIGIDWTQITEQVQVLCADFQFWNSSMSSMSPIEIAARLQNRLTRIHPFNNGNGRHARLVTDIFLNSIQYPIPKWPQVQLKSEGHKIREQYIAAMKKADHGNYDDLTKFIDDCISHEE